MTEPDGCPAAVLIRALEPVEGLPLMRRRRQEAPWRRGKPPVSDHALCRGPGNLTWALGVTLRDNRAPLTEPPLTIEDAGTPAAAVLWGPRVGIRVGLDRPWRVFAEKSHYVSANRRTDM